MYAIIEDSGTQIKVAEGEEIAIDRRDVGDEKVLRFDRVLLVGDAESDKPAKIGAPYVKGASVAAEVLGEFKGTKIDVIKFKRRKGYRRKQGHRQGYLRVKITGIKA
ncbi:MAG: 50S ribosomal protein L21 [Phycisphaerales bacterium]|nr:MAG: 50S ribosomal protein L21 [Phycisphaerales bacterium]